MSNITKGNVTKKGRTAKEVVAIMKAGAKAERERREATKVEAKSEVFQVRLEPSLVQYIESAAQEQGIRSSAFVRNLIAEKRDQKPAPEAEVSDEQAHMIWEVNHKLGLLIGAFNNLNEKVIKLETAFKNVGIVGIKGSAEETGHGVGPSHVS